MKPSMREKKKKKGGKAVKLKLDRVRVKNRWKKRFRGRELTSNEPPYVQLDFAPGRKVRINQNHQLCGVKDNLVEVTALETTQSLCRRGSGSSSEEGAKLKQLACAALTSFHDSSSSI